MSVIAMADFTSSRMTFPYETSEVHRCVLTPHPPFSWNQLHQYTQYRSCFSILDRCKIYGHIVYDRKQKLRT